MMRYFELHTMEKTIEWEKYGIEKVYTADNASAARLIIKDTLLISFSAI